MPQQLARSSPSGGSIRSIVRWGTPILHRPVQEVTSFDDELATLVADMFATMYAASGAGLAANQIGVDLSVFVFDLTDSRSQRQWGVICNPVLEHSVSQDSDLAGPGVGMQKLTEGCLSLPGASTSVARHRSVTVRGADQRGEKVEVEATGIFAQILHHEIDHLNGVVYGDRVEGRERERLEREYTEVKHEYPDDWPVSKTGHRWEL